MKYFFLRLLLPRADFMQTMNDAEKSIMRDHAAYWFRYAEKGCDPAIKANAGFKYEISPMPTLVTGARTSS